MDKIQELKKLKELFDSQVLTEAEYNSMKADILNGVTTVNTPKENEQSEPTQEDTTKVQEELPKTSFEDIVKRIKEASTVIDGIHFIEDKSLVEDFESLGQVYGKSGWGGLAESMGIKKAEKQLAQKVRKAGGNLALIVGLTRPMGGVKITGYAYSIKK